MNDLPQIPLGVTLVAILVGGGTLAAWRLWHHTVREIDMAPRGTILNLSLGAGTEGPLTGSVAGADYLVSADAAVWITNDGRTAALGVGFYLAGGYPTEIPALSGGGGFRVFAPAAARVSAMQLPASHDL